MSITARADEDHPGDAVKDVSRGDPDDAQLTTSAKALALNLDPATYGGFAEIGGGQEVARWFFSVGSAATGVAKATSAYDMAVSDALYGPTQRYVSRQRRRCSSTSSTS